MGAPKQLVPLDDGYLIDRVVAALGPVADPTVLGAGGVPGHLADHERIYDAAGYAGPLAGVLGALECNPEAPWLIVACDQPWVTSTAIEWLLDQDARDSAAVMPHDGERVQPFPGVYRFAFLEVARATGKQLPMSGVAISALADDPRVSCPLIPTALRRAWASVNTPQDLEQVLSPPE